MLLPRNELRYDFGDARFDFSRDWDREFLGWIFNQFLYGEVTGIQCGYWLYRAPHLNAATFLAKQAGEELSHVRKILRILSILKQPSAAPHWAIRRLASGMMGHSWGEHVALEMALGEGLVLTVFYAMAETIDEPEIKKILESAIQEEERHVEFGERETRDWLAAHPGDRKILLAQAVIQLWVMQRLKTFVVKRVLKGKEDHPVLSQFEAFYDQVLKGFEKRIDRLGLSDTPLSQLGAGRKVGLLAALPFKKVVARVSNRRKLLTETYLADPLLSSEKERYHLPS
jgi:1,2-phenylacetyl-CoA epoxidase catalytic subunit